MPLGQSEQSAGVHWRAVAEPGLVRSWPGIEMALHDQGGIESLDTQYPGGTFNEFGNAECLRVATATLARSPGEQ
jgi:hypothetical protein